MGENLTVKNKIFLSIKELSDDELTIAMYEGVNWSMGSHI